MDWSTVITALLGIFGGGSVVYLIIDKKVQSAKDKVENVGSAIPLYKEIRAIVADEVAKATKPLQDELNFIKAHYCCYRMDCEMRIGSIEDISSTDPDNYYGQSQQEFRPK